MSREHVDWVPVTSPEQVREVAGLAKEIWNEHYAGLLTPGQITYMVEHFQSEEAITLQLADGYQYRLVTVGGELAGYVQIIKQQGECHEKEQASHPDFFPPRDRPAAEPEGQQPGREHPAVEVCRTGMGRGIEGAVRQFARNGQRIHRRSERQAESVDRFIAVPQRKESGQQHHGRGTGGQKRGAYKRAQPDGRSRVYLQKGGAFAGKILRAVFLFCMCFVVLYPLLYMLSVSLREARDLYDPTVIWIPKHWTLSNYRSVIEIMDYGKLLWKTVMLSAVSTLLNVGICAVVGYGFARFRFRCKSLLFGLVIFTIIVPPQNVAIPLFIQYYSFDFLGLGQIGRLIAGDAFTVNLLNTPLTFYLPAAFGMGIRSGLFIYIFRQFFRGIATCGETGEGKNSPAVYDMARKMLSCQREECVVLEDSLFALQTAKAAGFHTRGVFVRFSARDQEALRKQAEIYLLDLTEQEKFWNYFG